MNDSIELKEILTQHALWASGSGGKRADLNGANLSGADLRSADLRSADLNGANLSGADLYGTDLRSANLSGADLSGADLRSANLRSANLSGANLSGANLSGANLSGANLSGADLSGADLSGADLRSANLNGADLRSANLSGADLRSADLSGANLSGANLRNADLSGVKDATLVFSETSIVPEDGAFRGWKKCKYGVLVRVEIPAEAARSNASGRKCRAEFVKVIEVIGDVVGISSHDGVTAYRAGETVRCDNWCPDRWQECAGGIHFFITRAEAEAYFL